MDVVKIFITILCTHGRLFNIASTILFTKSAVHAMVIAKSTTHKLIILLYENQSYFALRDYY